MPLPDRAAIRGLLLDAGGVLYGPRGDRWNPRHDFPSVVARLAPELDLGPDRLARAIDAGEEFLGASPCTAPRADYHRAVLGALGMSDPPPALLAALEAPLDIPPIVAYPEVHDVLTEIRRRGLPIAIVSDNWSGAEAGFVALGLDPFITCYAISADVGCCKPDPRIFAVGANGIGLPPEACLFVDDDPELVAAAIALGYHGVALGRTLPHPSTNVDWIDDLRGVLDLIPPALGGD